MEKIAVFLDYANTDSGARFHGGLDSFRNLLDYLSEGRFLLEAYAYVPIDPRHEHGMDHVMDNLWADGFMVTSKVGTPAAETFKCNFDVEMAVDMLRLAHTVRPDIVVLASGDGDMLPVVHELRKMAIRVEVAAFEHTASRKLASQASGFIRLEQFIEAPAPELPPSRETDDGCTLADEVMDEGLEGDHGYGGETQDAENTEGCFSDCDPTSPTRHF